MENSSLQFYWYEIKPGETRRARWGQLAGAMDRLHFVCDELEAALNVPEVSLMLKRLEYHAENYMVRAYELRERLVGLVGALGLDTGTARQLKASGPKREQALAALQGLDANLAKGVTSLLEVLERDVSLRNIHTHDTFLSLGIVVDGGPFDPEDVLLELSETPEEKEALERVLRVEGERLLAEYHQQASAVIQATMTVLKAADAFGGV